MKQLSVRDTIELSEVLTHVGQLLFFYANSEPQPNAKYSCAASVAIAR